MRKMIFPLVVTPPYKTPAVSYRRRRLIRLLLTDLATEELTDQRSEEVSRRMALSATKSDSLRSNAIQTFFDSDAARLLVDCGASYTMTPYRSDFVSFSSNTSDPDILGISGTVKVKGVGTVEYKTLDDSGKPFVVRVENARWVPGTPLRLLCPQQWIRQRQASGDSTANLDLGGTSLKLQFDRRQRSITAPFGKQNNVAFLYTAPGALRYAAFASRCEAAFESHSVTDDWQLIAALAKGARKDETLLPVTPDPALRDTTDNPLVPCQPCVPSTTQAPQETAPSLPSSQPEQEMKIREEKSLADRRLLLRLHRRLGHCPFSQMVVLAREGVIPRRLASCEAPKCATCLYAKATRRPWRTKAQPSSLRVATRPGAVVSVDQLESPIGGMVPQNKGLPTKRRYVGATVFVDHWSDLTYIHPMESLSADDTVAAKHAFERFAEAHGVRIAHYHADNGTFEAKAFQADVRSAGQTISYCGVNAHHQNGKAERRIRDITESARSMLLHAIHRWPGTVHPSLWPFALRHAAYVRNHLPRETNQPCPLAKFAGSAVDANLRDIHTFGAPTFVLDSALQQGKSIPKWSERARVGIFLCNSPDHAATVPFILNTSTGLTSPQFHVVIDDDFDTADDDKHFVSSWQQRFNLQSRINTATDQENRTIDGRVLVPWDTSVPLDDPPAPVQPAPIQDSPGPSPELAHAPTPSGDLVENLQDPAVTENLGSTSGPQSFHAPSVAGAPNVRLDVTSAIIGDQPRHSRSGRTIRKSARARDSDLFNDTLHSFEALGHQHLLAIGCLAAPLGCVADSVPNSWHPLAFAAAKADPDTMTLKEAMAQPDRVEFLKAMIKEVEAHVANRHWRVVPLSSIPPGNRCIMAVWSMKRKRNPSGDIVKWKARLCAHGGQQTNVDNVFAPVVRWSSVRMLLILSILKGWHIHQIDFVLAFPQAPIRSDVWMHLPQGFTSTGTSPMRLKLLKNLYGLRDAPLTWFEYISDGLRKRGFAQSAADPCVFYKRNIVLLIYVDDAILCGPDPAAIQSEISSLAKDFTLTDEGEIRDYLGIHVEHLEDGRKRLTQPRMIQRCVEMVGLESNSKTHLTPADRVLHRAPHDPPRKSSWEFRSVIGALMFLQQSTRPDINFAVHQASQFANCARLPHEQAVKRIVRYLKATPDKGLILDPKGADFECFVDADFAGAWSAASAGEEISSYSRTGYLIRYAGCPLIWASKRQTLIALSTTEAEYIALSTALREVIFLMQLVDEMIRFGVPIGLTTPIVRCRTFEDNAGALELANSPKYRPRTKHLSLRLHHFRQHVRDGSITIEPISTKDQLADIFTKPIPRVQFEVLRKQIMGW